MCLWWLDIFLLVTHLTLAGSAATAFTSNTAASYATAATTAAVAGTPAHTDAPSVASDEATCTLQVRAEQPIHTTAHVMISFHGCHLLRKSDCGIVISLHLVHIW